METGKEDYSALLEAAVDVAADLLEAETEFSPYALAIEADGKVLHIEPEGDDHLEGEQVVEAIRASLRDEARHGRFRAAAVVADVTVEDDDDEAVTAAIYIALEHREDDPVTCLIPYELRSGGIEFGELIGEQGESKIFIETTIN